MSLPRKMLPSQEARQLIAVRQWSFLDLFQLVCAYAELTDGGLDIKDDRVRITIKKLPLRKPAKKVAKR